MRPCLLTLYHPLTSFAAQYWAAQTSDFVDSIKIDSLQGCTMKHSKTQYFPFALAPLVGTEGSIFLLCWKCCNTLKGKSTKI